MDKTVACDHLEVEVIRGNKEDVDKALNLAIEANSVSLGTPLPKASDTAS